MSMTQATSEAAKTPTPTRARVDVGEPLWDRRGPVLLVQAVIVAAVLGAWEAAARGGVVDARVVSQPSSVAATLADMLTGADVYGTTIYEHLAQTLQELVLGYLLGCGLGVLGGILFARAPVLARIFQPYILAVYGVPKIALAPLFVLLFGIGLTSTVAVVTTAVFFMLFFNTYAGILAVPAEYVNIARIMGASEVTVFRRVILPTALPAIITGAKLGVPFAMIGAIVGEFIASFKGLGFVILHATGLYDASTLFGAVILLVVVVWVIGQGVSLLESMLLAWHPKRQRRSVSA